MGEKRYDDNCEGCKISQRCGDVAERGGIVQMNGDWILDHYGDKNQRFLGWLVLQPRYHRMELSDLSPDEVAALGQNIQDIDIALRQYWTIHYEQDPIQRVYVVYFFEGVYDQPPPRLWHLHLHLIPRPKSFDSLLRSEDGSTIIAWDIYTLGRCRKQDSPVPPEYRLDQESGNQKMANLMTYLKAYLWKISAGR